MNYDANCNRCDRLNDFLSVSKKKYPDYFCKPVPAFGDKNIKLLIVGLAPGLHQIPNGVSACAFEMIGKPLKISSSKLIDNN